MANAMQEDFVSKKLKPMDVSGHGPDKPPPLQQPERAEPPQEAKAAKAKAKAKDDIVDDTDVEDAFDDVNTQESPTEAEDEAAAAHEAAKKRHAARAKKLEKLVLTDAPDSKIVKLNTDNFSSELSKVDVALVYFYTKSCSFCKEMAADLEAAAKQLAAAGVVVAKVDAEDSAPIAAKYKINGYPTLSVFRSGEPHSRHYTGARKASAIVAVRSLAAPPLCPL